MSRNVRCFQIKARDEGIRQSWYEEIMTAVATWNALPCPSFWYMSRKRCLPDRHHPADYIVYKLENNFDSSTRARAIVSKASRHMSHGANNNITDRTTCQSVHTLATFFFFLFLCACTSVFTRRRLLMHRAKDGLQTLCSFLVWGPVTLLIQNLYVCTRFRSTHTCEADMFPKSWRRVRR